MSASPSSLSDAGSPRGAPGGGYGNRPSLARTSISTQSTTAPRELSSSGWGGYSGDIRSDLAAGWGGSVDNKISSGMAYGRTGAAAMAPAAARIDNDDSMQDEWGWRLHHTAVHPLPSFYPVDQRNTRKIPLEASQQQQAEEGGTTTNNIAMEESTLEQIENISMRISTACQNLSIHGLWDNSSPTATLSSMERVEMEVNLYLGDETSASSSPQVLLVELQRRKGCSITFHNYRRCLLDAAEGKFNPESFNKTDGLDKPLGRDRCNQPRASLGRPTLSRPGSISRPSSIMRPSLSPPSSPAYAAMPHNRTPSFSADDAGMPIAGLKSAEGETPTKMTSDLDAHNDIVDKALKALNMAASLIRKDRVDARRLGMESLVLLTDPLRAGIETAKIASRVVLLGTATEDAAMIGGGGGGHHEDEHDDVDALFDETSGLGIRETILEMIMADDGAEEKMESSSDTDGFRGIEKEFTDSLFNLCLTVLSNALHTIEESVKEEQQNGEGDDRKPSPNTSPSNRRRAATEPAPLTKRFIDDTNSTFGCDVLSSLIRILGQAKMNPHDAYHSARCLGVLFKGCGNSHKARARRDLDAKRIIAAALEVGSRSHAKLADASRVAMMALVTDDEDSVEEQGVGHGGAGGRTEMEDQGVQEETEGGQHQELPSVLESMSAESDLSRL
ncbi:hypothetical protein ACHAXR_007782 [Thalassiosira sp. AJA248-18]